ncbi:hypothetical protein CLAIMM_13769 [Cladophialophora immunda]|nr:hypothetical protein CLAIMM_13769 [Cladophialophora immunda]
MCDNSVEGPLLRSLSRMLLLVNIEFKNSGGVTLRGWFYTPDNAPAGKLPTLVMAHGFTALKEMTLEFYAESFPESVPQVFCLHLFSRYSTSLRRRLRVSQKAQTLEYFPLRTKTRGPAYTLPALPPNVDPLDVDPDSESYDCLDKILSLFRANTFFRNFEIKGFSLTPKPLDN